jgi:drug/metabolite transporter (DMT)-like permease
VGVALALLAASVWALGTQLLRRSRIEVPTLSLSFWMTVITGASLSLVAALLEHDAWRVPSAPVLGAIAYNAVLIFGYAHAAWFYLARGLPPVASTLSVMFIPVLGVFSGSLWLGEVLHWQDWAAVVLMMIAIASVLLPARPAAA